MDFKTYIGYVNERRAITSKISDLQRSVNELDNRFVHQFCPVKKGQVIEVDEKYRLEVSKISIVLLSQDPDLFAWDVVGIKTFKNGRRSSTLVSTYITDKTEWRVIDA